MYMRRWLQRGQSAAGAAVLIAIIAVLIVLLEWFGVVDHIIVMVAIDLVAISLLFALLFRLTLYCYSTVYLTLDSR